MASTATSRKGLPISDSCLIIPIHPKDFNYGKRFLESFYRHGLQSECDPYFVFSFNEDKEAFKRLTPLHFNQIIVSDFVDRATLNAAHTPNKSIVTYKKFCALSRLYARYKYLLVCDSEIKAIRKIPVSEQARRFCDRKTLLCGAGPGVDHIVKSAARFFPCPRVDEVVRKNLYFWFNNIPVYMGSNIRDFFERIAFDPTKGNPFEWADFDYIIYGYYLIAHHGFSFKETQFSGNGSIIESLAHTKNQRYYDVLGCLTKEDRDSIMWVSYNEDFKDDFVNAFLIFHLNCHDPI